MLRSYYCAMLIIRKEQMKRESKNSKEGFTIIEVVLVLAIAGLIFLMVFLALPALQRSQRNTQRRDDYSMLSTAVTNYMSNNGGRLEKILGNDYAGGGKHLDSIRWINENGVDPNNNKYEVIAYEWGDISEWTNENRPGDTAEGGAYTTENDPTSQVFIIQKANCNASDENGDAQPEEDRGNNAFAIYGYMEGGTYYCQASGSIGSVSASGD